MPLQLFLNGLSSPANAIHREQAIQFLMEIVRTARAAKAIDSQAILNCEESLNSFLLGPGFSVAALRNAGELVEEARYLKALNNRAPFNLAIDETPGVDPDRYEYRISSGPAAGAVAHALGLSHRLKGLSLSLQSDTFWRSRTISLDLLEVTGSDSMCQSIVDARNAAEPADIAFHEAGIKQDLQPQQLRGADIWTERAVLFPYLEFIPRTRPQIEGMQVGNPMLEQLWIKLSGINAAIAAWETGAVAHPVFPFNVRPESTSRTKYVKFNDADGFERTFSDHADLAPTEGRIHFLIEANPRKYALIGHIGRKLGIG